MLPRDARAIRAQPRTPINKKGEMQRHGYKGARECRYAQVPNVWPVVRPQRESSEARADHHLRALQDPLHAVKRGARVGR